MCIRDSYTIGQHRGLGLSLSQKYYVCEIRPEDNTVVLGESADLFHRGVQVQDMHWIAGSAPETVFRCKAKLRYRHPEQPVCVTVQEDGRVQLMFDEPQRAPTPGQYAVLYDGDIVLGGGVIVQRFGDLIRGQRTTPKRIEKGFMTPTLAATPGDLSLVMPKRILDGIIEMIYALDKIAPGTASDDTLLYGVEVKFYNMEVALDQNLETPHKGLFVIGDGSGVTHSLSHASASGVYVARYLAEQA